HRRRRPQAAVRQPLPRVSQTRQPLLRFGARRRPQGARPTAAHARAGVVRRRHDVGVAQPFRLTVAGEDGAALAQPLPEHIGAAERRRAAGGDGGEETATIRSRAWPATWRTAGKGPPCWVRGQGTAAGSAWTGR